MKDRGMMKWAPYKSLDRQSDFIAKTLYEQGKREKPLISEERAEKIDALLRSYQNEEVIATYYEGGYIYEAKGTIDVIDRYKKKIFVGEREIPFSKLIDIEAIELGNILF